MLSVTFSPSTLPEVVEVTQQGKLVLFSRAFVSPLVFFSTLFFTTFFLFFFLSFFLSFFFFKASYCLLFTRLNRSSLGDLLVKLAIKIVCSEHPRNHRGPRVSVSSLCEGHAFYNKIFISKSALVPSVSLPTPKPPPPRNRP